MERPLLSRPALRLVVEPTLDVQHRWYARAEHDARLLLMRHGHLLSDPSLASWVVEQCAELAWEWKRGQPCWSALRIEEVWRRLDNLHRFFPLPRLVVAYYETLSAFLPWLVARGQLSRHTCAAQLEELERVRSPMLEQARAQLAMRATRSRLERR
jgi:hypothetical protein